MSVKILIIDDDISIGNLEQEVLEQTGYQVLRAYSGTEAVLLLKSCRPDLNFPILALLIGQFTGIILISAGPIIRKPIGSAYYRPSFFVPGSRGPSGNEIRSIRCGRPFPLVFLPVRVMYPAFSSLAMIRLALLTFIPSC